MCFPGPLRYNGVVRTGLERLLEDPRRWLGASRVGLVANPTAVDRRLAHAADLLHQHPDVDLRCLFGPEHGLRGSAQDMVGVAGDTDPGTGVPVVSLYGATLESLSPTQEQLADIASRAGWDRCEAEAFLASDAASQEVRQEDARAREMGIQGVPCFVVDRRYAISGAQEPEYFAPLFDLVQNGEAAAE